MKSISRLLVFYLCGAIIPTANASTPLHKNEFLNVKINPFNQNVDKTKFITPDLKRGSTQLTGKNETYFVANINVDGNDINNCADKSNPTRCKTVKSTTLTIKDENNDDKGQLIVPNSISIDSNGFLTNTPSFIDISTTNPGFYRYWDFETKNWSSAVPIICIPDFNTAISDSKFEESKIVKGYLEKIKNNNDPKNFPRGLFGNRKKGEDYNEYSSNKDFTVGLKLCDVISSSISDIKGLNPIKWENKGKCLLPVFDNKEKITSSIDNERTNIIDPLTGVTKQINVPMKICKNKDTIGNHVDFTKQPSEICGKERSYYESSPYISFYSSSSDSQYYNNDYEILLPAYNISEAKRQGSTFCSGDFCNMNPTQYLATSTCATCATLNDNSKGSCEEIVRGTLLGNGCTVAGEKIKCNDSQLDKAVAALVQNSNFTGRDSKGKKVGTLKNKNLTCNDCIGSLETKLKEILVSGGG